jgi:nitrogenase molybdenum-cofactor synthesis protein NifE
MALITKVNEELRVDTTCSHAHKPKKSGCNKPEAPGLASGGCSYEGAYFALAPCSDALHLVHGPMTCLGSSWETRHTETSWEGRDYTKMGFTTDMSDIDVVYSGDKRLANAIDYVLERYQTEAVFVYETCVPALIGDDMDAVCAAAEEKWGLPVVPIHAPGFAGSKNFGNRLGLEAVINHLAGTKEPDYLTPYDINIIGDYNITGEMWQYSPLLEEIGIRILASFSGDARVDKMRQAHRAKLNIVVCAKSVEAVCKLMEQRWGIPFISASFYGMRDASESIRNICMALGGDAELMARAEAVIAREEARVARELEPFRAQLQGRKAVLNTGGNKAWSIAAALQDIGLEVVATSVRKSNEEDKEKARRYLGADAVLMVKPDMEQMEVIARTGADILLAGGRSLYAAVKKRIAFIDVNQEKTENYCGYNGLINLAREVANSLANPVFRLVDSPAPWERRETRLEEAA